MMQQREITLIYVSKANIVFDRAALDNLTAFASEVNKTNNVSGVLVNVGNHFMQVLEGPEEAVTALMRRILVDSRHRDIRIV